VLKEARARYERVGYDDAITRKMGFRMEVPRDGETPHACLDRCTVDDSHWSVDTWEPAACIDLDPHPDSKGRLYVFFGKAPRERRTTWRPGDLVSDADAAILRARPYLRRRK
jgi:hypothetical protein